MGEIWDDVLSTTKERELLKAAVNASKELCVTEHKKEHPTECPECWPRIINRMRDRYLNSSNREWFSGRRLFLQDLNTMFAEVLEHKKTLTDLEGRIQAEKEEWCREKLKNIGLISATDRPDAVQRLLNDKEKPLEQLITELITTLSKDAGDSEKAFEDFMQKLETAPSSDVRTEAYAETFFQTKRDPNSAASCNDYADMVRNGKSMSDTITLMVRERQAQGIKKAEKQSLLRRRDELTRAKAANAAAVAKKAKARQDRARAAAAAAQEYDLPPCENCKKAVDPQNLSFCDFCVTLADVYGFSDSSPTYFCSTECWEDGIVCIFLTHCERLRP